VAFLCTSNHKTHLLKFMMHTCLLQHTRVCYLPVAVLSILRRYSQGLWQLPNGTFTHAPPAAASSASGSTQPAAVPLMLKVKDYPPNNDFRAELPRHFSVSATPADSIHVPGATCLRIRAVAACPQNPPS
jgi:hypothetical protein